MRYAAYLRTSFNDQSARPTLDAQQRAIEAWIADRGGDLIAVHEDVGQPGNIVARPALQQLQHDAKNGKLDALVVHTFDRLARIRTDLIAIQTMLGDDNGVQVFSVTESSEHGDNPPQCTQTERSNAATIQ